jgi:hypothetical protein
MNCPQCQTANAPGAAFCGNCGAGLAVAEPAGARAPGYGPQGTGAPLGYGATSAPSSYDAPTGYGAPTGYNSPTGYNAPGGYDNAGTPQQPAGYPQGQYQPPTAGGYQPGSTGFSLQPANLDLNRLTTVDKVVGVASLITLISIWLPWFSVSFSDGLGTASESFSATTVHGGWMYLVFIVALVLIAYLAARAAWDRLPINIPVAHAPLLTAGTALQLVLVLIAFFDVPSVPATATGFSVGWAWGAFIGLLAALAAAGPVIVPAVRSYLESRNAR